MPSMIRERGAVRAKRFGGSTLQIGTPMGSKSIDEMNFSKQAFAVIPIAFKIVE
jgi:hypothetical protein